MDDIPRTRIYRLLEAMPGALSWSVLIGPFALSFWFPKAVAIFITAYVILWFLRALKGSIFLIYSYFKCKRFEAVNWAKMLKYFSANPPIRSDGNLEKETAVRIKALEASGKMKTWTQIHHVAIIPTYKEEKEILESSISAIAKSEFPLEKIIVVIATEERDRERAEANVAYLENKFKGVFGGFFHCMHPKNLPNEIPAKGANITYAGKFIAAKLKKEGVDFSDVLVTTLDADNHPHPLYFSSLTFHYLMEPKRERRSYQPLAFFYNNIWDVPFVNRLVALANTFWYMSESCESSHLFNASAYAQSLDSLVAMDFWSKHTIVEDLHQFWRAYFHFDGDHEVVPIFIPVYQDALQNKTYFTSLTGQYKQLRRWAWGASETPYVIIKMWKHRKVLPLFKNIARLYYMIFLQLSWATAPIIVLLNNLIPSIVNIEFGKSLFAYNLGAFLNLIFSFMFVGILTSLWISFITVPKPKGKRSFFRRIFALAEWILLPITTLFYGAIPALDAQTRLMLGKPLGFTVTEKIRKIG